MFGNTLKKTRLAQNLSVKELAQNIGVDPSLLSRIERNERIATEKQVKMLADALGQNQIELLKIWLEDKLISVLQPYPNIATEVLTAMESRIEYLTGPSAQEVQNIDITLKNKLKEIDKLRETWAKKRPEKGTQLTKMNESFAVEYTYESNRIEGSTLSLQETYLVIHEGLTIGGKSVQEHLEAINHDEAIEFVMDLANSQLEITEYRLKQIHHLILKGIDRKNAGVYRSVPVRIGGSSHLPPEPFMLTKLMEDLFLFYEKEKHCMHPVLLAAEMHERFVTIHPFVDGNGRTARLLMNLILLKNGYTIAILKGNNADRMAYYKALSAVQENANSTPFYTLISDAVERSLQEHLHLA